MHDFLLCFALCSAIFSHLSLPKIQLLSSQLINMDVLCLVFSPWTDFRFREVSLDKNPGDVGVTSFMSLFFRDHNLSCLLSSVWNIVSYTFPIFQLFPAVGFFWYSLLHHGRSGNSPSVVESTCSQIFAVPPIERWTPVLYLWSGLALVLLDH